MRNPLQYFWLQRVGAVHSLLSVLVDREHPAMRCSNGRQRATSRLFLDYSGNVNRAVKCAVRMGLVTNKFRNPYFLGSGEHFIGLTARGDACVDATRLRS